MNKRVFLMSVLVMAILIVSTVGTAFAAEPNGRAWGKLVDGEPGVWRVHFAVLGVEGSGSDWGATVSNAAQALGGLGAHSSGR